MQIKMITESRHNVEIGGGVRMKNQAAKTQTSAFGGAQCKVTISREGRKLSEQAKTQTVRSAQRIKAEKTLIRQQEQPEQADQVDEIRNQYLDLLEEIKKSVKSTNHSYWSEADKETAAKKQQLLSDMRNQKQKQIEENQKNAKAAQNMAMQSFRAQDEIDKHNSDLLVMLKSLEESEKSEEENKGSETKESDNNGAKTENSVGDVIQNSAARFTAFSIERELDVVGMIHALNEEGHTYVNRATEIERNAFDEADSIRNLFDDDNYTDDEKKNAVLRFGEKMIGAKMSDESGEPEEAAYKELKILVSNNHTDAEKEEALSQYLAKMRKYSDLGKYRSSGVQMIKDSKECKLKHIADNPLQGMEKTKDSMMQSAVDAAFNEASQSKLDETSQELKDAVKDLIDERNDITHVDDDEKEKDAEENKEVGELLQTEENDQDQSEEQTKLQIGFQRNKVG